MEAQRDLGSKGSRKPKQSTIGLNQLGSLYFHKIFPIFFNNRKLYVLLTYMKSKESKNFNSTTIQPKQAIPANNFKQLLKYRMTELEFYIVI